METCQSFLVSHILLQFKSYYVVWKRQSSHGRNMCLPRLNRTMQYGNLTAIGLFGVVDPGLNRTMQYGNFFFTIQLFSHHIWFKSYYVVWKRPDICTGCIGECGLNRTMQYGNHTIVIIFISCSICLNRTMQYGNRRRQQRK